MSGSAVRKAGVDLASGPKLKALMTTYYRELGQAASAGEPVAWCTSVGPAELLRALGFQVYFPENHGAMLGATRMAGQTMARAHGAGYSPDICSYLTSDIGAFLAGVTPLARAYGLDDVPRPTVLVYNTNQCREVKDWFSWYARRLGVPAFGIRSPTELGNVGTGAVGYVAAQLRDLAEVLRPLAPRTLDIDDLQRRLASSLAASRLWANCLDTAAARPAPWTFFDQVIHMAPIVVLRGDDRAALYYRDLAEELVGRVKDRRGADGAERHRLYWEGMPIWGRLRPLSELFSALGAPLVASTYCNSWILDFPDGDPWESMAAAYLDIFICRSEEYKEAYVAEVCRSFECSGVVFHDARTCPHNTNSRYGMPGRLRERAGLANLVLEGDLNDPRCFALEEARVRIEAFLEEIEEAGAAR